MAKVVTIRANQELRALIHKVSHIPIWKPSPAEKQKNWTCAGYGRTEVSETINGQLVTLKGRMVERNSTDGPVPVFTFDSYINGMRVNRTTLISTFSEMVQTR